MSSDDSERRRGHRLPIELVVEYKKLNSFFADYTRNISKGGTFIKTKRPLAKGTQFIFKLHIPTLPEPMELQGEVRWIVEEGSVEPDGQPAEPGMGIHFLYDNDEQRALIEKTVEDLMVEHLGPRLYAKLIGKDDKDTV
jgi:type IV pilus assembly protein PilZ